MAQQELTAEQSSQWVREHFQKANKYMAEKGILIDTVLHQESRYLVPLVAVWKMRSQKGKTYWVITGDLPSDHVEVTAASNARDAIRDFSLRWQLKADQILNQANLDNTQRNFAHLMINRAENLYNVYDDDKLWGGQA